LWESMKYGFCSQLGPESTWGPKKNLHQSETCFRQKSQTLCRYTFCNVHIRFMWQNNITKLPVPPPRQDACYWLHHLVHAICNQTSSFFQFDYTYITQEGKEKHLEPSPFFLQSCLRGNVSFVIATLTNSVIHTKNAIHHLKNVGSP